MIYVPYAGVGSRRTPPDKFKLLNNIGKRLDSLGLTLRSGGAAGADREFERLVRRSKEIFRPESFNGRLPSGHLVIKGEMLNKATEIAKLHHPYWDNLSPIAKELHTRNVFQVLGEDLESYSLFVICWTPDGADGVKVKTSSKTGGTGTAIRIANTYGIPVLNLYYKETRHRLVKILKTVGVTD